MMSRFEPQPEQVLLVPDKLEELLGLGFILVIASDLLPFFFLFLFKKSLIPVHMLRALELAISRSGAGYKKLWSWRIVGVTSSGFTQLSGWLSSCCNRMGTCGVKLGLRGGAWQGCWKVCPAPEQHRDAGCQARSLFVSSLSRLHIFQLFFPRHPLREGVRGLTCAALLR